MTKIYGQYRDSDLVLWHFSSISRRQADVCLYLSFEHVVPKGGNNAIYHLRN